MDSSFNAACALFLFAARMASKRMEKYVPIERSLSRFFGKRMRVTNA